MASSANRRPTNVSLDLKLVSDARELGINVSRACEVGLAGELKRTREARWLEENKEAIEASNRWIEQHGLPLAKYRKF